ncbi:MAG: hypothetical protein ACTSQQ_02210 [Candidatus Helarchaeota archaeon]
MQPATLSFQFIILCSIQVITIIFSFRVAFDGIKRYCNSDRTQKFLRKSVKYFIFILITVASAGIFTIISNIFFIGTQDGVIAGYLYSMVVTSILFNVFTAWQFLIYLLHPELRITKYPIGICSIVGIILVWLYPGVTTSVFFSPIIENTFTFLYLFIFYFFVYSVFAFEFYRTAYKSTEFKEKYRYCCIGTGALFSIMIFLGRFLGLIFAWIVVLNSTILLYMGYTFPKFFEKAFQIKKNA